MDIQTLIVALIFCVALLYVGSILFGKIKSFSAKSNCANDCGCGVKAKKV
jgi:hypothetical protein